MQSKPQQPSSDHHYIPIFLLKNWVDERGKLLRYRRNGAGQVVSKRLAPKSVCRERHLYLTEGLPPEHAQQVEMLFMQLVDSEAAKVHELMLVGDVRDLTNQQCSDWGRFVMSLWFRTPLDVHGLRGAVDLLFSPRARGTIIDADPNIEMPPEAASHLQMEVIRRVIDDPERGTEFINMKWAIATVKNVREFYVSDWPLCLPDGGWLGQSDSYVTLPLAPDRLFVAAKSRAKLNAIVGLSDRELIMRQNRSTVRHADSFVGAQTKQGAKFIENNFATGDRHSIARAIGSRYRAALNQSLAGSTA